MRIRKTLVAAIIAVAATAVAVPIATADRGHHRGHDNGHHRGGKGDVIAAAIAKHLANVETCNAQGLVDDYTNDARVFFPDGVVVSGRAELTTLYLGFVKPRAEGGLCGLKLKAVDTWRRGNVAIVKVEVTADFLAEPYFATDNYTFQRGKIAAEVSTFDASKLKFKT